MIVRVITFSLAALFAACTAFAQRFPGPTWKEAPDPNASRYAQPGGTLVYAGHNPPKSFNGYLDNNTFTMMIFQILYPTLLGTDSRTGDFAPGVADWWEISEDKMIYTFHIDPRARWSDGTPVTAEDVKATFDAIMEPTSLTGQYKVLFAALESPKIIDRLTVAFHCKEVHWRNLSSIGLSLYVMPKKLLDANKFNTINFTLPIVGGPYTVSEHKEGISMTLKRRDDYWGFKTPGGKGVYNFDKIRIRFFMDQNNAYEAFKKGEVDAYAVYSARVWNTESVGEKFEKNWIVKQNIHNHNPIGFQGLCFNMRKPPYDDLRVRQALTYLFDRQRMVRTLMYNAYFMQTSYFEDLYDASTPNKNTVYDYQPEKAFALLQEAGFAINPATGYLERNGKPLIVNILTRSPSDNVWLALYKEALSRIGIQLTIAQKDFATWMREMEKYNFEVTTSAFSGSLFRDPESLWSSKQVDVPSGVNLSGFKNKRVDELIEAQKTEFSVTARNKMLVELDKILTDNVPYALSWGSDSTRLLYWNKFGTPNSVLGKYGDELSIPIYWWYDADSAAELKQSMREGTPLPGRVAEVYYDRVAVDDNGHDHDCSLSDHEK